MVAVLDERFCQGFSGCELRSAHGLSSDTFRGSPVAETRARLGSGTASVEIRLTGKGGLNTGVASALVKEPLDGIGGLNGGLSCEVGAALEPAAGLAEAGAGPKGL